MVGELSNKLSYSDRHTFKKSRQGFRLISCKANSISIVLDNLDHAKAEIL